MATKNKVMELQEWQSEAHNELERAQVDLVRAQKRLEDAQDRLRLLNQLLALEQDKNSDVVKDTRQDPVDFLDACEQILRDAGEPIHIKELQSTLLQRGVPLPGRGTEANVIVRLNRSDGRFVRTGRGTYGLPEFGVPEKKPVRRRKTTKRGSSDD
jgi:HB1, ASXL, restriction endonuclease HTH domain